MKALAPVLLALVAVTLLVVLAYAPAGTASRRVSVQTDALMAPASSPLPAAREMIDICSDPWPPYANHAGEEREGYIVDLLRRILSASAIDVRYVTRPWSACVDAVREGSLTGLVGMAPGEAPDLIVPSEIVGVSTNTFFARKGDAWRYEGVASLRGRRLGVIQNYGYEAELDSYVRAPPSADAVLVVKGDEPLLRLFAALRAKRIDCFIEDSSVVRYGARGHELNEADVVAVGSLPPSALLVGLSPRDPRSRALAARIDRGIRAMRADGTLHELLGSYGVRDWVKDGE